MVLVVGEAFLRVLKIWPALGIIPAMKNLNVQCVRTAVLTFITAITIAVLAAPTAAQAEFKLAVVDLNRVLNETNSSKDKRKSLDEISQQAKKKIETKKQGIAQHEKKVKESGAGADSKEAQSLNSEIREFNRFVKDTEEEIKREFLKINKELTERAMQSVKKYAQGKDLDLVVDRSERGRGPILFGSATIDITDDIIKIMNGA
jgi:outer membrane protein